MQEEYTAPTPIEIVDRRMCGTSAVKILTGDANCRYLEFKMPRYYDGIDLSTKTIQIHYLRSDGKGSENAPVNVIALENTIEFGWVIPPEATSIPGVLLLSIEAFGVDYAWGTTPAIFTVLDGLKPGEGIPEPDVNWYKQFFDEINTNISQTEKLLDRAQYLFGNLGKFATFSIDGNGVFTVETLDEFKNIDFSINKENKLEVEY